MLRRNFANLQIGAGGDMAKRPAIALGEIGHPGELPGFQDAVRNPQPAHVGILCGGDAKQAVIAPPKIIRDGWWGVSERLLVQPRISIERMFFALEFLLIREFFAGRGDLVLRLDMRRVRSGGFSVGFACGSATKTAPDLADLQAGGKTFKVAFLLVGKVD